MRKKENLFRTGMRSFKAELGLIDEEDRVKMPIVQVRWVSRMQRGLFLVSWFLFFILFKRIFFAIPLTRNELKACRKRGLETLSVVQPIIESTSQ